MLPEDMTTITCIHLTTEHRATWDKTWQNCKEKEMNPHYYSWKPEQLSMRNAQIQQAKKISKYIAELNSIINQLDITDIYRLLHPMTAEYTLFSSLHETFTKEDHILCCKTHPYKFKRIEIISRLLSNHNRSKLEISNRNIAEKKKNPQWKIKHHM